MNIENNETYVCYGDYGYEGKTAPCYVGPSLEDCIKAGFKSNCSDIKIDVWSDGVFIRSLNARN